MEKYSENEAATFTFQSVDFNHKGSYFCEYHKKLPNQVIYYPQGNTVDLSVTGISCCFSQMRAITGGSGKNIAMGYTSFLYFVSDFTVKLEMPTISLSSPFAMVIYSPDRISVSEGNSFAITCSTHSTYPGGFFYLTKSNMTKTEAKQAFRHSIFYMTVFDFSAMEYKDQGDYTCIFGVNISSSSFCSVPSKPLQITVTGETLMNP